MDFLNKANEVNELTNLNCPVKGNKVPDWEIEVGDDIIILVLTNVNLDRVEVLVYALDQNKVYVDNL